MNQSLFSYELKTQKGKDKLDTEAMSCGYPDGNHLETLTKEVMIHCT